MTDRRRPLISPVSTPLRAALAGLGLAAMLYGLGGCATGYAPDGLPPGATRAQVLQQMGTPTGEYPRQDGGTRLEFARGPMGLHTYMLDFDAQDRLLRSEQVLDEAHFTALAETVARLGPPSLTEAQLRHRLGRPGRVWGVRYHDQTVYTYRYDNRMCQVFLVGLTPQGLVEDTSYGPDPACERRERFFVF